MFSKKFAAAAVITLITPFFAACGGTTSTTGGTTETFTWRAYAEPAAMDPALMDENLSIDIAQNIYDAMLEFDPNTQKVQPALAKAMPDVSPDGATFTFHLREDAKFSNGDPITADDVLYSYNRVATTKEAPYEFVMEDIKGFSDVRASVTSTDTTKPKVDKVSGIEAVDPHTVKITLNGPSAYFLSEAALWTFFVVNKKVVDAGGEWFTKPGAGSGAYTLTEWKHDQSMSLRPNENYWREKATVPVDIKIIKDTATAQAEFEKGTLSVLDGPSPADLDRIKKDDKLKGGLHSVGQARTVWIGLNVMKPPFGPQADAKALSLRKAIYQAIDRQKLVDLALSGAAQPVTTLLPKGEPGYQDFDAYPFNPDQAKKDLAAAGYPNGQGLDLTYTYRKRDAEERVAEQLQAQLKQNLGISIKVQGVEWKDMKEARQNHEYIMFYGSWGHDYPDPQNWLYSLFHSSQIKGVGTGTGNDPGYKSDEFDKLVDQANKMADPTKVDERYKLYNQAEQIMLKDAAMVPLYQTTRYWEVSDKWTGYNTNNTGIFPFRLLKPVK